VNRNLFLALAALVAASAAWLILFDRDRIPGANITIVAPDTYRIRGRGGRMANFPEEQLNGALLPERLRAAIRLLREQPVETDPPFRIDIRCTNQADCTAADLVLPILVCNAEKARHLRIEGVDISLPGKFDFDMNDVRALFTGGYPKLFVVRSETDLDGLRAALAGAPADKKVMVRLGLRANYGMTMRALGAVLKSRREYGWLQAAWESFDIEFRLKPRQVGPDAVLDIRLPAMQDR
jgi:hypothetical protein